MPTWANYVVSYIATFASGGLAGSAITLAVCGKNSVLIIPFLFLAVGCLWMADWHRLQWRIALDTHLAELERRSHAAKPQE